VTPLPIGGQYQVCDLPPFIWALTYTPSSVLARIAFQKFSCTYIGCPRLNVETFFLLFVDVER